MHSSDANKLKQYIEKIENLEEEKAKIQEDMSDVFAEAKADGFDVKVMKKILKLRKMKEEDRENEDYLLDTYMMALGMIPPSHSDESSRRNNDQEYSNHE